MASTTIALSLISHTNAGKTTLARTLLAQSVGEVRDAAHVTLESTAYPLIDTPQGDQLVLWDTPGFGDSARLAKRLQQHGNPIGWFMSQVWDRFRDQAFWLNQLAVRNTREQADVVLYLVNAAEEPGDAGYLEPELSVLAWIGKPVVVLLNQTGPRRPREEEQREEARWRSVLQQWPQVKAVLTLDAFARCWVQEFALFDSVDAVLEPAQRGAFARLSLAWRARRMAQFDASMRVLAGPLADAACDHEPLAPTSMRERAMRMTGMVRGKAGTAQTAAMAAMAGRLALGLQDGMQQLIAVHGLEGKAAIEVIEQVARDVQVDAPVDESRAALVGGAMSGALTGVAADLAMGGLSFGAGM
ncbi:MAG: GTPase, partial [Burkholderiaceae bacterium]